MKPFDFMDAGSGALVRHLPRLFGLFAGPSALKAAEAVLGMAISALLVRTMSVAQFGQFSFIFSLVRIFTLPARLGVSNLMVKEISREAALGNYGKIYGSVRWGWRFASAWAVLATLAVTIAFRVSSIAGGDTYWLATATCCLAFCAAGPVAGAYQGIKRPMLSMLPETLIAPLLFVSVLTAMVATKAPVGVGAALALRGGLLCICAVLAYVVQQHLPRWRAMRSACGTVDARRLMGLVIPFTMVGSVLLLNQQAGLMLAGYLFDAESVALYRAAEQFAIVLTVIPTVLNTVALPYIAESAQLGHKADTRTLINRAMIGSLTLSAGLVALLVLAGRMLLIHIYGPEFAAAYPMLLILAIAWGLNGGTAFNVAYLNMSDSQRPLVFIVLSCVALQVLVGVVAGSLFGLIGLAAASGAAIVLNAALVTWRTHRDLRDPGSGT